MDLLARRPFLVILGMVGAISVGAAWIFIAAINSGLRQQAVSAIHLTFRDVAWQAMGQPSGALNLPSDTPSCRRALPKALEAVIDNPRCAIISKESAVGQCVPLAATSATVQLPHGEHVRTLLGVEHADSDAIWRHIQEFSLEDLGKMLPVNGGPRTAPLADKSVSMVECGEYAILIIDQSLEAIIEAGRGDRLVERDR